MSIMLIGVSIWTVIVIVGVIVAGLIAASATGGLAGPALLALIKVAFLKGGLAFVTSGLGSLIGCLKGC